jgi:hypothetical protein
MIIQNEADRLAFSDLNRRYNAVVAAGAVGEFTIKVPASYRRLWSATPEGHKNYFKAAIVRFEPEPAPPIVPICFALAAVIETLKELLKQAEEAARAHQ